MLYFGKYFTNNELRQLIHSSSKFEGDYRNSIVYKHSKNNWSIKQVKCNEKYPTNLDEIKSSLAWTELYFVNELSPFPNFINYVGFHYDSAKNLLFIITEWVPNSTTLCHWLSLKQDFYESFQLLLQVFVCLEIMYKKFNLVHNDCIPSNIILEKVDTTQEYFVYHFNNKEYFVKNVGYKVYIWDYSYCKNEFVSFNDLDVILKTCVKTNVPEKYKDYTRILESLCYKKYQDNMIYPIAKNWFYRYIQTNTLLGMCVKPTTTFTTINIFY